MPIFRENRDDDGRRTTRRDWLLALFYAPDQDGRHGEVYGKSQLMQGMFLLDRLLKEKLDIETEFSFEKHKYGPIDPQLNRVLSGLIDQGFLTCEEWEGGDSKGHIYYITEAGKEEATPIFESLTPGERQLIDWVKFEQMESSLSHTFSYLYSNYPEMFAEGF